MWCLTLRPSRVRSKSVGVLFHSTFGKYKSGFHANGPETSVETSLSKVLGQVNFSAVVFARRTCALITLLCPKREPTWLGSASRNDKKAVNPNLHVLAIGGLLNGAARATRIALKPLKTADSSRRSPLETHWIWLMATPRQSPL